MSVEISLINNFRLVFVGGGQMASALIVGLLKAGWSSSSILVIEPYQPQREHLAKTLLTNVIDQACSRVMQATMIVWAVKPQSLHQAIEQTRPFLRDPIHVSIAAGIPLDTLQRDLGSDRVVRAMPNTAALVGAGVTGMVASQGMSETDIELVMRVLSSSGYCFWVESDERLDAVTAVSGSGPAYVFHFLEAFQAAAEAVGFDPETARELVRRTAAGALEQTKQGDAFGTLRERVTSKRGTTEAALAVLDQRGNSQALVQAVRAAYGRAGEISREMAKGE